MIPIVLKITPEKNEIAINTPVVPKTALPKYPIIVAENNLFILIDSIDSIIIFHLIARKNTDRTNKIIPRSIKVILEELK